MLKSIVTNTAAQLAAKFVGVVLTFATTVLIIRLGGPDLFGDVTKVLSLIAIGFTAIDFGLNAEAVRSMTGTMGQQKRVLRQVFLARGLLSLVAVAIMNLVIFLLPGGYTPAIKSVFWVGSIAIIFQGVFTSGNAWFQRRLVYWKSSVITGVGSLIGAIATYFVVRYDPTLGGILVASTMGYAVMAGLTLRSIPPLSGGMRYSHLFEGVSLVRRSLGLGVILVLSIIASKTDAVLLGIFRTSNEVGQYGFAYRIFDVLLVVPTFVMNSIYPLLVGGSEVKKRELVRRSSRALVVVGVLGAAVAYYLAPLILWIRPDMSQAVTTIRILSLSLPVFYLTAPRMWQLIEARQENRLIYVYGVAALANGVVNYLLVPQYGSVASSWITCGTELFILGALYLPHPISLTKKKTSEIMQMNDKTTSFH